MHFVVTKLSLADSVILHERSVCRADEGAAAAFHTKHNLVLIKNSHSLVAAFVFKRAREYVGLKIERTRLNALSAMDAG